MVALCLPSGCGNISWSEIACQAWHLRSAHAGTLRDLDDLIRQLPEFATSHRKERTVPYLSQGDIFELASKADLTIVFGNFGPNPLCESWVRFRDANHLPGDLDDPFLYCRNEHPRIEWQSCRWIQFIETGVNNGLTTDDLQTLLADALHWAREQYLFVVATNGARDTNYEIDDPRGIDDERAKWLIEFATILEVRDGLEIYLRSPDDVFVRNE